MEHDSTEVRVTTLKQLEQRGQWRLASPHSLPRHQLFWITKGQGRVMASGQTKGFGPHTAVFLPPNTMHAFEFGQGILGYNVTFPFDLGPQLPGDVLLLRIKDTYLQGELTQVIEQMAREVRDHGPGWYAASRSYAALTGVQLERMAGIVDHPDWNATPSQRIVNKYTLLIEENLPRGLSVSEYADMLDITPTHLTRVCRETCGVTASTILQERVISEARRLLEDTDRPVRDIAQALGFTSAAYFTRAFGNRVGATPTAIRAKASAEEKVA